MLMPLVPPSVPLNVSVVAVDETDVLVSWNRPKQPGSPALTGYKLCFNGTCDTYVKEESTQSVVSATKLKENECSNVTVYAVSESDHVLVKGPQSEHVWIVTGNVMQ